MRLCGSLCEVVREAGEVVREAGEVAATAGWQRRREHRPLTSALGRNADRLTSVLRKDDDVSPSSRVSVAYSAQHVCVSKGNL